METCNLYPVPENVQRLANLLLADLWHGPIYRTPDHPFGGPDDGRPWPGFQDALEAIERWARKRLPTSTVYYLPECGCWTDREPEWELGPCDECGADFGEECSEECETGRWDNTFRLLEPEPWEAHPTITACLLGRDLGTCTRELAPYLEGRA